MYRGGEGGVGASGSKCPFEDAPHTVRFRYALFVYIF